MQPSFTGPGTDVGELAGGAVVGVDVAVCAGVGSGPVGVSAGSGVVASADVGEGISLAVGVGFGSVTVQPVTTRTAMSEVATARTLVLIPNMLANALISQVRHC